MTATETQAMGPVSSLFVDITPDLAAFEAVEKVILEIFEPNQLKISRVSDRCHRVWMPTGPDQHDVLIARLDEEGRPRFELLHAGMEPKNRASHPEEVNVRRARDVLNGHLAVTSGRPQAAKPKLDAKFVGERFEYQLEEDIGTTNWRDGNKEAFCSDLRETLASLGIT